VPSWASAVEKQVLLKHHERRGGSDANGMINVRWDRDEGQEYKGGGTSQLQFPAPHKALVGFQRNVSGSLELFIFVTKAVYHRPHAVHLCAGIPLAIVAKGYEVAVVPDDRKGRNMLDCSTNTQIVKFIGAKAADATMVAPIIPDLPEGSPW